jgi:hypothetical protein
MLSLGVKGLCLRAASASTHLAPPPTLIHTPVAAFWFGLSSNVLRDLFLGVPIDVPGLAILHKLINPIRSFSGFSCTKPHRPDITLHRLAEIPVLQRSYGIERQRGRRHRAHKTFPYSPLCPPSWIAYGRTSPSRTRRLHCQVCLR